MKKKLILKKLYSIINQPNLSQIILVVRLKKTKQIKCHLNYSIIDHKRVRVVAQKKF